MKRKILSIVDDTALTKLAVATTSDKAQSYSDWILITRTYLRMSQSELASRAGISQSHIALIESGKKDPRVSTLQKIFDALSCHLSLKPAPKKPLSETLRGRARSIALKRLKQSMGTMALEGQAPDKDMFRRLLEKQTDEILNDPHERLWNKKNDE